MTLHLGDTAPDFTEDSTEGPIQFHKWIGDHWAVFFSHPADYTPVCTTELGSAARLADEFQRRDVKVLAVSVDPVASHADWIKDISETEDARKLPHAGRQESQGGGTVRHDPSETRRHSDRTLGFHHRPHKDDPYDSYLPREYRTRIWRNLSGHRFTAINRQVQRRDPRQLATATRS